MLRDIIKILVSTQDPHLANNALREFCKEREIKEAEITQTVFEGEGEETVECFEFHDSRDDVNYAVLHNARGYFIIQTTEFMPLLLIETTAKFFEAYAIEY